MLKMLTMIDLNKLQDRFDTLFEQESEESFNRWLEDKKKRDIIAFLGKGKVETMKANHSIIHEDLLSTPLVFEIADCSNNIEANMQYAMAA